MPKPSADLKQTKLSFAPVRKTPPPIVISSPNRKSVSDLADNFEQQSTARITRSRSNLSVPIEPITPIAPLKRAASLDNTMSNKASEVPRKGEKPNLKINLHTIVEIRANVCHQEGKPSHAFQTADKI